MDSTQAISAGTPPHTTDAAREPVAFRGSFRRLSYLTTIAVSAVNIIASVVTTGILARAWTREEFLLYGSLNRYTNFLFTLASGCLGYGVVHFIHHADDTRRQRILSTSATLVAAFSGVVAACLFWFRLEIAAFLQVPTDTAEGHCAGWVGVDRRASRPAFVFGVAPRHWADPVGQSPAFVLQDIRPGRH